MPSLGGSVGKLCFVRLPFFARRLALLPPLSFSLLPCSPDSCFFSHSSSHSTAPSPCALLFACLVPVVVAESSAVGQQNSPFPFSERLSPPARMRGRCDPRANRETTRAAPALLQLRRCEGSICPTSWCSASFQQGKGKHVLGECAKAPLQRVLFTLGRLHSTGASHNIVVKRWNCRNKMV